MVADLEGAGLRFTGRDDKGARMEILELDQAVHPFYLATQYHPEYQTRPRAPSPPFAGFVRAASGQFGKL